MQKENPVTWFEVYVDDMDRAVQFYETVFNTKLESMSMPEGTEETMQMWSFPGNMESKAAATGALVKMDGMKAGGNSTIVYFNSEDCSVEESRVVEAGGQVIKTKESIGEYGHMSLVSDTEGNVIGIHSMK